MKIFNFNDWSVFSKIVSLIIVILFPILIVVRIYTFPLIAENSLNNEKESLRNLVESVISLLKSYDQKVHDGIMTLDEAKNTAASEINKIRYSNERYFFGVNYEGVNIIPGIDSIHTGGTRLSLVDIKGKQIIKEMINIAVQKGSGYLEYYFYKPGESEWIQKISYISEFKPWGWCIGTGFYVDEVEAKISSVQKKIIYPLILTIILGIIFAFIISRVILRPIKKLTNTALDVARGHFENIVDIDQHDEIGILAKAFNSLINSFKGFSVATKIAKMGYWEWKISDKYVVPGNIIHEIYGLQEGELIQYEDLLKMIEQNDTEKVKRSIEDIMNGANPDYIEFRIKRTDGQIRDILGTHVIIKNEKNELVKLIGFNIDITEKKKNEKDIYSLLNFQSKMLDTTTVWINTLDVNGNVSMWNRAAENISGYKKEEVIGHKKVFEWLYPDRDYFSQIYAKVKDILDKKLIVEDFETNIITKDGNIKTISWKSNYLTDENGCSVGSIALGFDITDSIKTDRELKIALSRAEEANKLKSVLLSNMSHELRTPMNGIMGFAGILRSELPDKIFKNMADKIYESSIRLMNTFDSILNLAELESGSGKYAETPVDLVVCTSSIISGFEKKAKDKNLEFNIKIIDQNIVVRTEEVLYKRILSNLLDNAVKFTNKGEISVEIDSERSGDKLFAVVRVRDTGIGISSEFYEDIFIEFRQVSQGLNRQYEGNGLGLSIARKTARLLGGDIKVESELGKGSVLSIKLPGMYLYEEEIPGKEEEISVIEIKDEYPLILLVEDNLINQEIITIYLEGNYIVETADDGKTAINKTKEKKYAAILMDINLGEGIDGIVTAEEIKKVELNHNTPIIAVTGYTPSSLSPEFRNKVCAGYLLKPFMKEDIIILLERLLKV